MFWFRRCALALLAVALPMGAFATLVDYASSAAFDLANPTATAVQFDALVADDFVSYVDYTASGLTVGPDSFSASAESNLFVVGAHYFGAGYFNGTSAALSSQNAASNAIRIDFSGPVRSFALDFGSFSSSDILTLDTSAGDTRYFLGTDGTSSFAGFLSDVDLTSVTLSGFDGATVNLGQVRTAPLATPEPISLAVMGLGLAWLGSRKRV